VRNTTYAIYNTTSGRIIAIANGDDEDAPLDAVDGKSVILDIDPSTSNVTDYILGGEVTLRPAMGVTADDVDVVNITSVPVGAELFIDDQSVASDINTGSIALSFGAVGTYEIKIIVFPYIDQEYTIDAT